MHIKHILFVILLSIFASACSQSPKQTFQPANRIIQTGIASYYADKYQGRQTASGELFDQSKKTAAHKTLPFGTWVKVNNLENGKNVIVKINDRGPFVKGRIIDLSKSAFSVIGSTRKGIIRVSLQTINMN